MKCDICDYELLADENRKIIFCQKCKKQTIPNSLQKNPIPYKESIKNKSLDTFTEGIEKKIPVYVRKGRNVGKKAGDVIFKKDKEPYYYQIKNWKINQLYQAPRHRNTLSISKHILEFVESFGAKKYVAMIVGMEKKSFYYIVPLKDFWDGEKTEYDDPQYRIRIHDLPRYYPEQESISKWI